MSPLLRDGGAAMMKVIPTDRELVAMSILAQCQDQSYHWLYDLYHKLMKGE